MHELIHHICMQKPAHTAHHVPFTSSPYNDQKCVQMYAFYNLQSPTIAFYYIQHMFHSRVIYPTMHIHTYTLYLEGNNKSENLYPVIVKIIILKLIIYEVLYCQYPKPFDPVLMYVLISLLLQSELFDFKELCNKYGDICG